MEPHTYSRLNGTDVSTSTLEASGPLYKLDHHGRFSPRPFLTDINGIEWTNTGSGWVGHRGKTLVSKRALGHVEFQNMFWSNRRPPAEVRDAGVDGWRYSPTTNRYSHKIYGTVELLRTNGVNAYIKLPSEHVKYVMFDNITEIKPEPEKRTRKSSSSTKSASPSTPKVKKVDAALMAQLDDLLT